MTDLERLFPAVFPTGIFYADRAREEHGDYKRLADISFSRLELTIDPKCPKGLRKLIEDDAAMLVARKGEPYQVSTAGQTITLGYALDEVRQARKALEEATSLRPVLPKAAQPPSIQSAPSKPTQMALDFGGSPA